MDKRNQPPLLSERDEANHPKSAAPADQAATGSSIVFCGDPVTVRAGFALALHLMGMDAEVPDVSERDQQEGKS
jgi:hypothetical protein